MRLDRKNGSLRTRIVLASCFACVVTIIGLSQTLLYKSPSPIATSFWFPLAVILKVLTSDDALMFSGAVIQFPTLSVGWALGTRRYGYKKASLLAFVAYLLLAFGAIVILQNR